MGICSYILIWCVMWYFTFAWIKYLDLVHQTFSFSHACNGLGTRLNTPIPLYKCSLYYSLPRMKHFPAQTLCTFHALCLQAASQLLAAFCVLCMCTGSGSDRCRISWREIVIICMWSACEKSGGHANFFLKPLLFSIFSERNFLPYLSMGMFMVKILC